MIEKSERESDVLEGAKSIAEFLFGAGASESRAYTAIRRRLPVYRIGNRLFARKSKITRWIEQQENNSVHES